ncbi:DUF4907 domain-containing protein [Chitinophaga filiformis]|uniref:DUF4907 domain-containing protein n=1 Tax=Chitinophaga filiformis TaxID=104663 RepID=A0ABY4I6F5_CHIFI|nr:DUF4907 domain-containing protein [Chitinophaga filiformis]UPK71447.1 DUF4907 domain-containing protein [Chitinophaga filiformis]
MTNNKSVLRICMPALATTLFFAACQQPPKQTEERTEHTKEAPATAMQDSIAVVTFQPEGGGWGFKINRGTHTYIEQPFIPVIMGRTPFKTEADALKVGELLAAKLRKNPAGLPDLTRQELLDMKIAGVE